MATRKQVELILRELEKVHPEEIFRKMDETQAGIGAVLRMLHQSSEEITAGKISETLAISTARVAVLLKKMVAKGLIIKERASADARVTVVKLTARGKQVISEIEADIYAQTAHLIDTLGEARLLEFITILGEIKAAFKKPKIKL